MVATIPVGVNPAGVGYDSGNGFVYVANAGSGNVTGDVSVINGTTVVGTVPVGKYPDGVAYNSGNGFVYVANAGSGSVSVINGTTVVGTVPVGVNPWGLAYDSRHGYVYVANYGGVNVSVISGTTVVATLGSDGNPDAVAYDSGNGFIYVANENSDLVSVFNGTTGVARVTVGSCPFGVAYDSWNGFVYVANWCSDNVSLISGASVVGTIPVGKLPRAIGYDSGNGYIYVANSGSNTASVIGGTSVVATIPVGPFPDGVAYDSAHGYVYVANVNSNTVSVISPTTTTPSPPQRLVATPGDGRVDLAWNPPALDGGSPITGYRIYRGTSPGADTLLATVGNVLVYSDTGLTNGVSYYYQVSAVNPIGESPRSDEAYAAPGAPTAPRSLQATPRAAGIDLVWRPPASEGLAPIMAYRLYRGTAAGGETFLADIGNILTYSDANVSAGTAYFYQISAVNLFGEGTRAPEVSATTQSAPGPGNVPFPWTSTAIASGIILASAAAVATLLHSRILREEVLQRKVRMLMFEYTRANPGSSFSTIRDAAGLKNGVAAYHLHVLEKQGLVHSKSHRGHRWFYPNGDVSLWRDMPLSSLQSTIINEVRSSPGLGIRDLARAMDRRPSSVAYNVKVLARENVLRTRRVGTKLCCYVEGAGTA